MITGLDHIGVAVRSIEESRVLYEALGLRVETVEEVPREGVRVAIIPCGETRIELLEPTRDDSAVARFLDRHGPGIHHLCLASDDIRSEDRLLRDDDYRLVRDEPTRGAEGRWVQFIHPDSADGVLIELSEPSDGQRRARPD